MDAGLALAADPANANLPDLEIRVTSIHSPWYGQTCHVCRDKFREGDQVRLCPRCGKPYHDDSQYNLRCWHKRFAGGRICTEGGADRFSEGGRVVPRCEFSFSGKLPGELTDASRGPEPPSRQPVEQVVTQFLDGLEKVDRPFGELQRIKVQPGSDLVGHKCPWCRFRIRAGDWVVACPCESNCDTFFHQDVFRHLTCWNEWNGVTGHDYCPSTGARYKKRPESGQ
jgi:hypothetical protein